ncbi:hypothetical protein C8R45DRAFT_1084428 [Mycena sanguinolenta]|nr:hypothetical protein C8R45DRAFT_1084428 [Mycena sanguinolenta]
MAVGSKSGTIAEWSDTRHQRSSKTGDYAARCTPTSRGTYVLIYVPTLRHIYLAHRIDAPAAVRATDDLSLADHARADPMGIYQVGSGYAPPRLRYVVLRGGGCVRAVIDRPITPLTQTHDAPAAQPRCTLHVPAVLAIHAHRCSAQSSRKPAANWGSHIACARLESGADARCLDRHLHSILHQESADENCGRLITSFTPRGAHSRARDASTRLAVDAQRSRSTQCSRAEPR